MVQGVESLLRWIELSRAIKIFQSKQACAFSSDLDPKAIVDLRAVGITWSPSSGVTVCAAHLHRVKTLSIWKPLRGGAARPTPRTP